MRVRCPAFEKKKKIIMKVYVLLRLGLYAGFGCGSKVMKDKQRKDLSTEDERR